ncbi:MAG: hypothetical protein INR73_22400 [Williamsia sp.]|nr:hypothetical protein [Williamsia sp.]
MSRLEMEEKLWSYIDGFSTEADKAEVEDLLKRDTLWKDTYHELLSVQQLLHSAELEEPSMRFTRNVMEEIAKLHIAPAAKTYINKNIVYGLGIFFTVMIAGLLVFAAVLIGSSTTTSSAAFHTNLDKFDWGKLFDSVYLKIFLMVNTVLVLMLVDKYLSGKKHAGTLGKGA